MTLLKEVHTSLLGLIELFPNDIPYFSMNSSSSTWFWYGSWRPRSKHFSAFRRVSAVHARIWSLSWWKTSNSDRLSCKENVPCSHISGRNRLHVRWPRWMLTKLFVIEVYLQCLTCFRCQLSWNEHDGQWRPSLDEHASYARNQDSSSNGGGRPKGACHWWHFKHWLVCLSHWQQHLADSGFTNGHSPQVWKSPPGKLITWPIHQSIDLEVEGSLPSQSGLQIISYVFHTCKLAHTIAGMTPHDWLKSLWSLYKTK